MALMGKAGASKTLGWWLGEIICNVLQESLNYIETHFSTQSPSGVKQEVFDEACVCYFLSETY